MMHPSSDPSNSLATQVVSVPGSAGLLSAIPALLGFHPTESVVMVCMTGTHRRLGPVLRVDLDPIPAHTALAPIVTALAMAAARHADEVAVLIYTDLREHTRSVAAAIGAQLGRICPVLDVIVTGNTPHMVSDELAAAFATHGRAVLTDRAELVRSIEHQPGTPPAALLTEFGSLADRDALIARMLPKPESVAVLVSAAQSVPDTDPRVADLCTALALVAYRHGDGALAQVAVNRSQRTSPDHRMTALILQILDAQITPAALDELLDA